MSVQKCIYYYGELTDIRNAYANNIIHYFWYCYVPNKCYPSTLVWQQQTLSNN